MKVNIPEILFPEMNKVFREVSLEYTARKIGELSISGKYIKGDVGNLYQNTP